MVTRFAVDTSTLLRYPQVVNEYKCVILSCVLRELEKHKISRDEDLRYQAREATRVLEASVVANTIETDYKDYSFNLAAMYDPNYTDNQILQACKESGYGLITDDLLLRLKSTGFGVEVLRLKEPELYVGYRDVVLNDEVANIYLTPEINHLNLLLNEYLIVRSQNGKVKDKFKWTENGLEKSTKKSFKSKWAEGNKIEARNTEQELYIDMLHDDNIFVKVVSGAWGTGKDVIALNYFLNLIDAGKFKKIIWARNNIDAKDIKALGFLPGDQQDKLSPYAELIGDLLGEKSQMDKLIDEGKIELVHTGFLRGRDFSDSIIYCSEAQNTTANLLGLIMSRASKNATVFLNGDIDQVDGHMSRTSNGLITAINTFKGMPHFGHVQLKTIERSEIARMANLLR